MARIKKIYPSDGTGALVLGIALSAIGGGLLLEEIIGPSLWDYLGKLWPVLLIVMGIKILASHYRRRDRGEQT